jgi:cysteine desulfurase/selenocysteine lyase
MLNVEEVRGDFPILKTGVIYLDSAATSLTPEPVVQKTLEYYHEYRANVERGIYRLSQKASEEYSKARSKIAKLINARRENEVVFTKNTTESINLIANGMEWRKGDKIVTTLMEHHSNLIPWQRLNQQRGIELEVIRPSREGILNLSDFESAINDRTRLVALTHVSNVLGAVAPVEEVARLAHSCGSLLLVDGAQSVPHMTIDVKRIGCDFLAFSGHKMLGPTGIGVLYMREELEDEIQPHSIGGGGIKDVTQDQYKLAESPGRFESGTPPIAEAIGLGEAAEYLSRKGLESITAHEGELTNMIYKGLQALDRVEVYGPTNPDSRKGIVSFNIAQVNPHDVALALDISGNVMVRSGYHCSMPLVKDVLGLREGTVRASVYLYNTKQEVDKLIELIGEIAQTAKN